MILLSVVFYRIALYLELRSIGFYRLDFVDNKAALDISLQILNGELQGPLMKASLWFIQFQAILLRFGVNLDGLHMIQYLSGILLVWTLITLGKRVFGSAPALIGGAVMAFYGPLLFQGSQLVAAAWAALFLTLAVLLPLSALGGINFFIGSGPGADGSFTLPEGYSLVNHAAELGPSSLIYPGDVLGRTVSYTEASRFWTTLTLEHMGADPLITLSLLGKKNRVADPGMGVSEQLQLLFLPAPTG